MCSKAVGNMADVNPQNYMRTCSRRIIIKENSKGNGEKENPSVAREIIIKEATIPEKNNQQDNSEQFAISRSNMAPADDHSQNLSLVQAHSTSTESTSTKSSIPESSAAIVTFDPQPPSRTILSKSAGSPSKESRSKSPAAIVTLSHKTATSSQVKGNSKSDSATTTLEKARAYQALTSAVPKIHRVLPEDCQKKYERYTYLPGTQAMIYLPGTQYMLETVQ